MPLPGFPIHPEQSTQLSSFEGVRIREDTLYSNSRGKEKGGIRRRAQGAIHLLQDALLRILGQDEAILYVAPAQALPSELEQFLFFAVVGLGTKTYRRGALFLSNTRLLYLTVGRNGEWQRSIRSARWGDIDEAKVKGWLTPTLHIKYRNGTREPYWHLRRDDAKKIKVLIAALLPASSSEAAASGGMAHLCPDCLFTLTPGVYKCARCGLLFKDERTMIRRALMFPGLGYLYARHPRVAVLDFLLEVLVIFEIVFWILIATRIKPLPAHPHEAPFSIHSAWTMVAILVVILAFKKWLTIRHCQHFIREFIPVS